MKKSFIRIFKAYIKDLYESEYSKSVYYRKESSVRQNVRDFFVELLDLSDKEYRQCELLFFFMILPKQRDISKFTKGSTFKLQTLKAVFGNKPSLKNCRSFFSEQIVQELWQGRASNKFTPFQQSAAA